MLYSDPATDRWPRCGRRGALRSAPTPPYRRPNRVVRGFRARDEDRSGRPAGGVPGSGLAQHFGQQPFHVLTVGGLVEAEAQREERIVSEQIGHLLADAAGIGGPSQSARE
jgi:hypothetical protein